MDRTYANLVTFLHNPHTQLAPATVQSLVSNYIANLHPSATPLVAVVAGSSFTEQNLTTISAAFRSAVHHRKHYFDKNPGGLFSRSLDARWSQWNHSILDGLRGSQPLVHLACSTGLVLGLADLKQTRMSSPCDDLVIALAQCIDSYAQGSREMDVALSFASQGLSVVPDDKLKALPLSLLAQLLTANIDSIFVSGTFLNNVDAKDDKSAISSVATSEGLQSMGPLSKLAARVLSLLIDTRPQEGIREAAAMLTAMQSIASRVRSDWGQSSLSGPIQASPDTSSALQAVHTTLKTFLFSFIMISRSSLSSSIYVPTSSSNGMHTHISVTLAKITLTTFFHLSFILSQFGGVTASAEGGAFPQLLETFYLALDIVAAEQEVCEQLIVDFCATFVDTADATILAKQESNKSFALACIEQLTPVLNERIIEDCAFPLCFSHLHDPSHREIFESAHSVILAVLSSQATKLANQPHQAFSAKGKQSDIGRLPGIAQRFVPYYCHCLLENSAPNRLNTNQLRLAYTSLVQFTIATAHSDDRLSLYVLHELITLINTLAPPSERRHALVLTFISCLGVLPLRMLPDALQDVKEMIVVAPRDKEVAKATASEDDSLSDREQLVKELFDVLFDQVGYGEKEYVKEWWYEHRDVLLGSQPAVSVNQPGVESGLVASEDGKARM